MIGALLLIALGALLLLTNFDVLSTGVWLGMLTLWPVLLIAAGVMLLVPREAETARASIAGLAMIALAAGGAALDHQELPARGRTADVAVPLGDAEGAAIDLEVAAGRLRVSGGAADGDALTGTVGLSRGQRLVADSAGRDGVARVRVAAEGRWFRLGVNPNRVAPWDVRVTDTVPVVLRLSSGVGEAEVDLRQLTLEEARLDVGLGRTVVVLPDRGRPRIRVDGGVGEVFLRVPDTIPARVAIHTSVGSTSVEGTFRREGDVYTTPGWDDATERIDVTVETSLGSVRVIQG